MKNSKFSFTPSVLKEENNKGARLAISAALKNPTSLQFGPDGKLYVSQKNGLIRIFTIAKNGPNDYAIASQETISLINGIPNHNDDGTLALNITVRQVTGLVVTGTATNPILYVSSSDSREGGPEGDLNLDTNSGIISKLTKTATGWDKVDLVRGLPRSEENHSVNGMQIDGNMMYLAVGGITNAGSPSTNFAFTPEYALTACVLSIDLAAIEAMPTQGTGPNKYKYDIPTLDDPDRPGNPDANDPFGGNDGLNQAKIVPGGPVQVFASGFRNPYDLVITKSRKMYVTDNGANPGWGGHPENEGTPNVTNNYVPGEPGSTKAGPHDPKVNNLDHFHYIGDLNTYVPGSYYAGHPNPIRANPAGAGLYTHANGLGVWRTTTTGPTPLPADWPPVPVNMANPIESDFQNPGETNNALLTFNSSSNGITEYTSSLFNSTLKGHLLIASFDGNIQNVTLTADGSGVLNARGSKRSNLEPPFASNFGSQPLDIVAQGDNDIFPGTVWVVCYLQSNIYVFEPENTSGECVAAYSTSFDDDGDGYSNADEIDNGTNPCTKASRPSDADGDFLSDLNDPDDDNDGLNDDVDYFALDPSNGTTTNLPIRYELFNGDPGTGLFGVGFTGLMLPMKPGIDYQDLFDPKNLIAGGAVGAFSVEDTSPGDSHGTQNNQENGFQFGVNTTTSTGAFTVQTRLLGPYFNDQTPQYWQSLGTFIGTGDQDNYLRVTLGADGGAGGVEVLYENNGVVSSHNYSLPGGRPSITMDLFLAVNPVTGMVQPKYSKDNGPVTNLGPAIQVSGPLLEAIQGPPALAVGIISTSVGSTPFTATWDFIRVTQDAPTNIAPALTAIESTTANVGLELAFTAQATDSDVPAQTLTYSVSGPAGATINPTTGAFSWIPTTTGTYSFTVKVTDNGKPVLSDEEVFTVTVSPAPGIRVNAGGPIYTTLDGNQFVADTYFSGGTTAKAGAVPIDATDDDALYQTERYGNFSYNVPVNNGYYNVTLHFAETFSGVINGTTTRKFNVDAEGVRRLTEYNIAQEAGGTMKAVRKTIGVNVTDGTLNLSFTQGSSQSAKVNAIEIVAGTPPPNHAPILASISNQTVTLGQTLNLTVLSTDSDDPAQILTYSVSGQATATINPTTGALSWTPTSTGTFNLTVQVTDNGSPALSDQKVFSVIVNSPGGGQQVVNYSLMNADTEQEIKVLTNGEQLNLSTLPTRNLNIRANTSPSPVGSVKLVLSGKQAKTQTDNGVPYALFGDINGNFNSWTPAVGNYNLTSTPYTGASASGTAGTPLTISFTVIDQAPPSNLAPVLASIGSKNATVGKPLTFTAQATDADVPAQALTYSVSGPAGVTINPNTGAFSWTPSTTGIFNLTVKVTDNGTPVLSAQETISITVNPDVPGIRVNAGGPIYTTLDGNQFVADTYFTGGGTSNAGAVPIDATDDDPLYQTERYGNFSYNVPVNNGYYNVTLHFAETFSGVINGTTTRKFNVDAEGVRRLTEYNIAQEAGGTMKAVRKTIGVNVTDGTLNLSFTQGSSQNPKVNAIEILAGTSPPNHAPVLASISSQTVTLGQSLTFTVEATDADADQSLTYSLTGPASASINASTGAFSWKPTATGTTSFTIKVTDNGTPVLSDQKVFTVTVVQPPFAAGTRINAGGPTYTATDGRPFSADTYFTGGSTTGVGNVPIDNTEDDALYQTERYGAFSYDVPVTNGYYNVTLHFAETYSKVIDGTTTRKFNLDAEGVRRLTEYNIAQKAGGTLKAVQETIGVSVSDGTLNLVFSQGSSQSAKVNAIEIVAGTPPPNQAPILTTIGSQTVSVGQPLSFTAQATDGDSPAQTLTYSVSGPASASINASTGAFTWKPTTTGTFSLTVKVTDNGSPALSAQEVVSVTVIQPPFAAGTRINAGGPAYTMIDGRPFVADTYFTGGGTSNSGNVSIDNTEDDALYRTDRYGNFSYDVPVTNGYYNVILHFAETYSGVINGTVSRTFNVDLEGRRKLTNYDIAQKAGGTLKAVQETIGGFVTDGTLNLVFSQGSGQNPKVNAIEIVAATAPPNKLPVLANALPDQNANVGSSFTYQFAENSFTDADGDILLYTATLGDNSALPSWLSFNATTRTFSGVPPVGSPASLTVKVTASDDKEGSVSDSFVITITTPVFVGTWQTITPTSGAPTARQEGAYVQAGDKFYLMGGRGIKPVQVYDPVAKSWVNAAETPLNMHHFQAVTMEGLVYAVGALTDNYPAEPTIPNVYIYDPKADKWIQGPAIPENRRRGTAGAVVYNNKIYLVGGNTKGHNNGYVAWFDEFDPATGVWKTMPDAPHTRDHFQAVVIGTKLYAAGGRRSSANTNQTFMLTVPEVDVYDFATGQWSTMTDPIPTQRAGASAVALDNELVIIGGESPQPAAHNETEALNVTTGTWRRFANLQQGRHATQAIVANGTIYTAAGSGAQGGSPVLSSQEMFYKTAPTTPTGTPLAQSAFTAPSSVTVGYALPNTTKDTTITVSNTTGNQALVISAIVLSGSSEFTVQAPYTLPFVLPVGKSIAVNVKFKPVSVGDKTATVTITHSGAGGSTAIVLNGTGVNTINTAPVLTAIGSKTATAGQALTFTAKATDANTPAQTLIYSVTGPVSASINASTGAFTWTPTATGTYSLTIKVTDNGTPALSAQEVITVTVSPAPFKPGTRINAGGIAYTTVDGRPFVADTYFNGGGTSNAGNVPIDNTEDDALYRTERYGDFSYDLPVSNGYYNVTLHFAETFSGVINGTTTRKFNVDAEGVRRLSEYDIAQKAGGTLKAVQEIIGVYVTDGTLNLSFSQGSSQSAKVNAIEVVAGTPPPNLAPVLTAIGSQTVTLGQTLTFTAQAADPDSPAQTLTYSMSGPASASINASTGAFSWKPTATGTTSLTIKVTDSGTPVLSAQEVISVTVIQPPFAAGTRINAGGVAYTALDGRPFVADTYFSGGSTSTIGNAPVDNTEDDALYQTDRYGAFTYDVPVTNGYYNVTLHFAETFSGVINGTTTRKFNIDAEGVRRLTEFDIAQKAGGTLKAVQETLGVYVKDGTLNLAFSAGSSQSPKVNAIEIVAATAPPNQLPAVAIALPDQSATLGTAFNYQFGIGSFTDADGDVLTYTASLENNSALPAWLTFNATTRTFSGTPTSGTPASLTVKVTANDGKGGTVSDSFVITIVTPANSAPVLTAIGSKTVIVGQTISFTAQATDSDVPAQTLTYSVSGPASASINATTGAFTWTPTTTGTSSLTIKVTDNGSPVQFTQEVINVTVNPLPYPAGTRINAGGVAYTALDGRPFVADTYFTGGSTSTIGNAPVDNTEDDALYQTDRYGAFSYSVPVTNGYYNVILHFAETFSGVINGTTTRKFNVDAEGVRRLTEFDIAQKAGGTLKAVQETIGVNVTDGNLDIAFSAGSSQSPKVNAIEIIAVTAPANQSPLVANALPDQNATVGTAFSFQFATTAFSDADGDALTYTATLENNSALPTWLSFNASTRTFSGTPTSNNPANVSVKVTANDGRGGSVSDSFVISIGTTQATNTAPVLTAIGSKTATAGQTISFTAQATDSDVPVQTLTYSVSGASGASINASTGAFSWTPTTTGTYSLTVKVTDNGSPALSAQEVVSVTVNATAPANQPPVVANALPDQNATVGTAFSYQFAANSFTDPDNDALSYTATLENNAALPSWLSFNASTRTFSGTPTSNNPASVSVKVTATDGKGGTVSDSFVISITTPQATNTAPVLASIGNKIVTLGQTLSFTAQATDADTPAQTLTYSVSGPASASINASTGAFSWTPTSTGTFSLTVKVTDNGSPALSAQEIISVAVNAATPTNQSPVVANALPDQNAKVGTAFSFQFGSGSFTDPDGDALSYSATLENNSALPAWLSFNANTRTFSGTPTSNNPASLTVKVTANDGKGGTVSDSFVIAISPANTAPVLTAIGSKTATVGQALTFTAQATDSDTPAQTLTYSVSGASGASINASTGAFSWTPTTTGTVSLTVTVTDNGSPALSAQELVSVTVSAAPAPQQAVISFSLINATSDQEIRVLTPGEQINLATLASKSINIRANTNPVTVGSVRMVLGGKQNRTQTDNGAPYALFGDSNGNYNNWTPATGSYTLTGTPYTASGGGGTAGVPLSISFTVWPRWLRAASTSGLIPTPVQWARCGWC
ncbi:putative Ig domain-containing protein [Larkinella insperata]|uniref:putative Ig domain-containing protein n=1 Tax=Larkinella insperata TaxID=332158 RepID=UPI002249754A|nr:putative Ig domain-containing protein [Larkinella insperata]